MTPCPKSMSSSKITHNGIVENISGGCIQVRISQSSACAGCKVAKQCSAWERKEKIIDIINTGKGHSYAVGDKVKVAVSQRAGSEAVALAFVIPFAMLILTIFACSQLTGNEAIAALSGIAILIPYYIILYILRGKISRRISFTIEN